MSPYKRSITPRHRYAARALELETSLLGHTLPPLEQIEQHDHFLQHVNNPKLSSHPHLIIFPKSNIFVHGHLHGKLLAQKKHILGIGKQVLYGTKISRMQNGC